MQPPTLTPATVLTDWPLQDEDGTYTVAWHSDCWIFQEGDHQSGQFTCELGGDEVAVSADGAVGGDRRRTFQGGGVKGAVYESQDLQVG